MPAQAGNAIVFYHELAGSRELDPMAWHTGCFVRGAETRWTMQKFKESAVGPPAGTVYYLPKKVDDVQTLAQWGKGKFKVTAETGLTFLLSKSLLDKHTSGGLEHGQIFRGIDDGEWVKVERDDAVEPSKGFYRAMKAHHAAASPR